jgi:hypothetical protein
MTDNNKRTSSEVASLAADMLQNPDASPIAKSLAASALAQSSTSKQTGATMEELASRVLASEGHDAATKKLAASILSQSNKSR